MLSLIFGIRSTVDDNVDTLSEYPMIIPFETKGGFHVTISVIIILLIFPGTEKQRDAHRNGKLLTVFFSGHTGSCCRSSSNTGVSCDATGVVGVW